MNQLKYRNLMGDDKQQICSWKYAGEYEIYNLPSYDVMKAQHIGFMNPSNEKNYFAFLDKNVLVGFVNILEEDTEVRPPPRRSELPHSATPGGMSAESRRPARPA